MPRQSLPRIYPQFFPAHWLDDATSIAATDFPSHVKIGYVVRGEGSYSFVMEETRREWGVEVAALHERALENLGELPLPSLAVANTPGGPGAWLGESDDNFNAVRLLLPQVQLVFARELGADYRFAIPCRDWAFCWSASQSMAWQEKNAAEAEEVYLSDDYSLSPDVYRMSGGRIEVCKPRSAPWPK